MALEKRLAVDPVHDAIDIFDQDISYHIWQEKYRWGDENNPMESIARVVGGVYAKDSKDPSAARAATRAMELGLWVPGGRIQAGAGTSKAVTLMNCYVDQTIDDSMIGIAEALRDAMLTMQQGGGIGMDFSTLRPSGANLQRTGAVASGPLPFMDMWNSMCATIMSAGSRRGAMMATMHCEHPDVLEFIKAKHQRGRLTNFNVSVLVTEAFMEAVRDDADWLLGFTVPRADGQHVDVIDREDMREQKWYVYQEIRAREIWDTIIRSTYEYSEPGVIFIDRVNEQNNLQYVEDIQCTNPCGEQPLPPNGCCNLGAVNLARMVRNPFTRDASFDFTLLEDVTRIGVRFLDNVIDVAGYPLEAQKDEEFNKRRIGIGVTGLADAMSQLGLRYGSEPSLQFTSKVMESLKVAAYEASVDLAAERGSFPLYVPEKWGATSPVVQSLPLRVREKIRDYGIRNGVLLTIAPTGTTSIYYGNVSSGLEPVFDHVAKRAILQPDGNHKHFVSKGYGALVWGTVHGNIPMDPDIMVTTHDLTVEDHVRIQAVCQRHVDASISKTINCPEEMTFEDFQLVYWDAYERGCKGCTTYRPSEVRGAILSRVVSSADSSAQYQSHSPGFTNPDAIHLIVPTEPEARPEALHGTTYKLKWGVTNYYVTINNDARTSIPREVFISSTSAKYTDWQTALSLMVSAIMRKAQSREELMFIPEVLRKVISATDSTWVNGKFYGSLVALIGSTLERHLNAHKEATEQELRGLVGELGREEPVLTTPSVPGDFCPQCEQPTLYSQEGCYTCLNCGYSNCG